MPDQVDPFSVMTQASIGLHELFRSLVEAGFTEVEALDVIAKVITNLAQSQD